MNVAMALLRRLEPERAHRTALLALRFWPGSAAYDDRRLATTLAGLRLANPIGLAAGFDKNGVVLGPLSRLGFGWVEAGTVTCRPQPGNPRPRLFRLTQDQAAINRMGFNNDGIEAFARNIARATLRAPVAGNVGLNKEDAVPLRDYPVLVRSVAGRVAYVAVNVSSPNTPGLRDLQTPAHLASILAAIRREVPAAPPLFVKLAPDLEDRLLPDIVAACCDSGAAGLIIGNTTLARPASLRSIHKQEPGGLSGAPLMPRSTEMLRSVARLGRGRLSLIGVGGIVNGADVVAKLRAGASAVQVYTAFAYHGPRLLPQLKRDILENLDKSGIRDVASAVGLDI